MENFSFDATQHEPQTAFDPVPDGWYAVTVTGAEWSPTKAGPQLLKLTLEIDGNAHPQFANRKLWDRLNLNNTNQQAREIAQRTLSSICHAIGKLQLAGISDLLGARLRCKAKAIPAEGQYEARNEVKGYKALDEAVGPKETRPAPVANAASAPKAAPWKR
jgi:hypothetical protein